MFTASLASASFAETSPSPSLKRTAVAFGSTVNVYVLSEPTSTSAPEAMSMSLNALPPSLLKLMVICVASLETIVISLPSKLLEPNEDHFLPPNETYIWIFPVSI